MSSLHDTARVTPQTKYARTADGVSIAYQVLGKGPRDLIWVPGWVSHLEAAWEEPSLARFFDRLATFSRLILFDKRGTGLSDRVPEKELPSLETRMDDMRSVCDAVGSEQAALLGVSEGAPLCVLFAATYPERTTGLVLFGGYARRMQAPDYPWGTSPEAHEAFMEEMARDWGGPVGLEARAPSRASDPRFREAWARYLRLGASPAAVLALTRMNAEIDVRSILPAVQAPTLVLHRTGDRAFSVDAGRHLAQGIPGASFVELPGDDHLPWIGDADAVLGEIERFLTGAQARPEADRVLATVLFTDIVGSTEQLSGLGDARWKETLAAYDDLAKLQIERHHGIYVNTTGDGFLATFDGPARSVRCALAIGDAARPLGLEIRAGCHTGEIEIGDGAVGGIAVHIGARVMSIAGPSEVLVSSTVRDLTAGSGLEFTDAGEHELKGVPGRWRLYRVAR
jgi:class 3 adenylate cyclase/pimeloyl-ACP methyl ester carboxylesterase